MGIRWNELQGLKEKTMSAEQSSQSIECFLTDDDLSKSYWKGFGAGIILTGGLIAGAYLLAGGLELFFG